MIGTHADPAGRTVQAQESAWTTESRDDQGARLVGAGTDEGWGTYGVGDTVKVRFAYGTSNPEVSRYLFAVLARGLRTVSVQGSPSFATRFTSSLVPNAQIRAVRFTGTGYEIGGTFGADLRVEDRSLDVSLTTDRDRYQPGERVTVTVITRNAIGRPTPASVFVRAVDEKLFAMGAANMDDPLGELYGSTGSGLVATGWSHGSPIGDEGDGKDTGGARVVTRPAAAARTSATGWWPSSSPPARTAGRRSRSISPTTSPRGGWSARRSRPISRPVSGTSKSPSGSRSSPRSSWRRSTWPSTGPRSGSGPTGPRYATEIRSGSRSRRPRCRSLR